MLLPHGLIKLFCFENFYICLWRPNYIKNYVITYTNHIRNHHKASHRDMIWCYVLWFKDLTDTTFQHLCLVPSSGTNHEHNSVVCLWLSLNKIILRPVRKINILTVKLLGIMEAKLKLLYMSLLISYYFFFQWSTCEIRRKCHSCNP